MARKGMLLALLLVLPASTSAGTLNLIYRGFAFSLREPQGWIADYTTAAQIASFVLYPEGLPWRQSRVVCFVRFLPPKAGQTLQSMIRQDRSEFQKRCPFYEERPRQLKIEGHHSFRLESFYCPGFRHELVAFTQVPGFFITFTLSSESKEELEAALKPFREILSSFHWKGRPRAARPRP